MSDLIIKRLIKEKTKDVIHTSAYGEAQNAGKIGTASTSSFLDRLKIDRNRTRVRGYDESKIVNETRENGPEAKKYEVSQDKILNREPENTGKKLGIGDRGVGANGVNRGGFSGRGAGSSTNPVANTNKPAQPPARRNPGIFR